MQGGVASLQLADIASLTSAEADAWYCFVDLISDFRDHFCKQLVRVAVLLCVWRTGRTA